MGPIGHPKTFVRNGHSVLHNIPEEHRSYLLNILKCFLVGLGTWDEVLILCVYCALDHTMISCGICVFGFAVMFCACFCHWCLCISHQRICTWNRKEHYISSWRNIILCNDPVKLAAWPCHLSVCCSALSTATIAILITQPSYLLVCSFIAFFTIMMRALWHLMLYRNYVVLPTSVCDLGQNIFACLLLNSYFAEFLFGLYSCECWWVVCSRSKWLCLHLCRQDVFVHAFLVFNIVYVARLCVVCKAVFFNHYQHVIIIERCWSALQRDHRGTPNHWVVIQILSERVSFLYSTEIDDFFLDAWSYGPVMRLLM